MLGRPDKNKIVLGQVANHTQGKKPHHIKPFVRKNCGEEKP